MKIFNSKSIFTTLLLLIVSFVTYAQTVVYVKYNATGLNNGTSWANAYTHLVDAVNGAPANAEIWIANGSPYKVTKTNNVTDKITLTKSLAFYGGFVGNETLKSQVGLNTTEINGEIGVPNDYSDNTNSAFKIKNTTVTFNGIEFKYFNNESNNALGVIIADTNSVVSINNCTFSDNLGATNGTCISAYKGSKIDIDSTKIMYNRLTKYGSMITRSDDAFIKMTNSFISNNGSSQGGYIFYTAVAAQSETLGYAKSMLVDVYNVKFFFNDLAITYSYFGSTSIRKCRMDVKKVTSSYYINVGGDSTSLMMDSCSVNGEYGTRFLYANNLKSVKISNSEIINTYQTLTNMITVSTAVNVTIENTTFSKLKGSHPIDIYATNGNVTFDNVTISDSDVSSYLLYIQTKKCSINKLSFYNNLATNGNYIYCDELSFMNSRFINFTGNELLSIGYVPIITFDNCYFNGIRTSESIFRTNTSGSVSITNSQFEYCFMTVVNPGKAFLFSIWNGQNYYVANCKFNNIYGTGNLIDNDGNLFLANSEFTLPLIPEGKSVFSNTRKLWVYNSNINAINNKVFLNDTSWYAVNNSIEFRLVNSIVYSLNDTIIYNKVKPTNFTSFISNNISNKNIEGTNSISNCTIPYTILYDDAYDYIYNKGLTPSGITQYPVIDYFGAPRVMAGTVDIGMKEYQVTTDVFATSPSSISSIKAFPNPTAGVVNILSDEKTNIQIVDQEGQVVYEHSIEKGVTTLELNQLKNGVYFIRYLSDTISRVDKLIVMK